jgi:hypothetical protein
MSTAEVFSEENSAEQEMYHVIFQNGARTTIHSRESSNTHSNQGKRGHRLDK